MFSEEEHQYNFCSVKLIIDIFVFFLKGLLIYFSPPTAEVH